MTRTTLHSQRRMLPQIMNRSRDVLNSRLRFITSTVNFSNAGWGNAAPAGATTATRIASSAHETRFPSKPGNPKHGATEEEAIRSTKLAAMKIEAGCHGHSARKSFIEVQLVPVCQCRCQPERSPYSSHQILNLRGADHSTDVISGY